jgi:hypothetical protein
MTEPRIDRRTFLKGGLLAGGLLATGGAAIAELANSNDEPTTPGTRRAYRRSTPSQSAQAPPAPEPSAAAAHRHHSHGPNILVILVDQLRTPQWFTAAPMVSKMLPNISRLRREGVSFERHYTASNDCTPARSALLTGLYTHQTGCMITGGSTLDPGFPTYGTLLREQGYSTWWFGKWHLTHHDNHWSVLRRRARSLRLRRRHLPLPRRRPRTGLAHRPADRRPVRRMVRSERPPPTVVHDRLARQPPRHRLVVALERRGP